MTDEGLHERAQARVGSTIGGKYRIDGVLGVGGMAVVYRVTHRNQAVLAVKVLHPELAANHDVRSRFLREAYAANSVRHDGVVKVLDDDVDDDGVAFLVMELLEGSTVESRWEGHGRRMPPREAARVVADLLAVLAAAHEKGIIHRDIKPSNLFLTRDGVLKVLDFGIARVRDALGGSELATGAGVLMGTPAFMAPEQALAQPSGVDARTDVWAAGATLFTLLSGQLVHGGASAAEVMVRAATKPARGLAEVAAWTPPSICRVVDRALAFDKADRWPTAGEMRAALEAALRDLDAAMGQLETLPATPSPAPVPTPPPEERSSVVRLALPDKPSIAVLPFTNMSNDPDQEYFADGVVEDLITALARLKWLFVIARNSTFIYKGQAVDIRKVGRQLGVRYVLEGSVRRAADRVRITAQLIEAESGRHVWADRYDGALADVFALQDRIAESVVGAVEPSVRQSEIERARRKPPESLDAYDLYLRALPYLHEHTPAGSDRALRLLGQALEIDPNYSTAHAFVAWAHEQRFMRGGFHEEDLVAAIRHGRAAIANRDDPTALATAGFVLSILDRGSDAGPRAVADAIALNPSSAVAFGYSAVVHAFAEQLEVSIDHAQRSLRLSPFDPLCFFAKSAIALASFLTGRFAEGASASVAAIEAAPGMSFFHVLLVANLVRAGHLEQARAAAAKLLEIAPDFTPSSVQRMPSGRPETMASLAAPLREIGMRDAPEGTPVPEVDA